MRENIVSLTSKASIYGKIWIRKEYEKEEKNDYNLKYCMCLRLMCILRIYDPYEMNDEY